MEKLHQQFSHETDGDYVYIEKIKNWLKHNDQAEFHTNLFDLEIIEGKVYIYSCLTDNLVPDVLTPDEFYDLLLNCLGS